MTANRTIKLPECITNENISVSSDKECSECKYKLACMDLWNAINVIENTINTERG